MLLKENDSFTCSLQKSEVVKKSVAVYAKCFLLPVCILISIVFIVLNIRLLKFKNLTYLPSG